MNNQVQYYYHTIKIISKKFLHSGTLTNMITLPRVCNVLIMKSNCKILLYINKRISFMNNFILKKYIFILKKNV